MPTEPAAAARSSFERRLTLAGCALLGACMVAGLLLLGRIWWCEAGDWWPWSWDVWSRHNSQHWVDPYALSHLQHGIGLYLLLSWVARGRLTSSVIVLLVAAVEVSWELAENSSWLIERYRTTTVSLDYVGDSICNSLGDYLACLFGIVMARSLPWWMACGSFAALEISSLVWIRDSLSLNILMLVYPVDAVRMWQQGT